MPVQLASSVQLVHDLREERKETPMMTRKAYVKPRLKRLGLLRQITHFSF
jgi:hypothetical protein